jgi:uncharacterized protein (TIGR00251 family)
MPTEIDLQPDGDGVRLSVKVVPGASRSRVAGVFDRALRVAVAAPPEGGRANAEVIDLLAGVFGVKRASVQILRGQTQRLKLIRIEGLNSSAAAARLAAAFRIADYFIE